jgi:PKD domain
LLLHGRDGGVAVVYVKGSATYASIRRPGSAFSAPRQLLASPVIPQPDTAALDDTGTVWLVQTPPGSVVVTELGPGGSAVAHTVDTLPGGTLTFGSALAVTPSGQVRAAYSLYTPASPPSSCTVSTEVREADGGHGGFASPSTLASEQATSPPPCATYTGDLVSYPEVAAGFDGSTVVTYEKAPFSGGGGASLLARYRPSGGSWPAPATTPETVGAATSSFLGGARAFVAAAGTQYVAAVWSSFPPLSVAVTSRSAGGSWSVPKTLSGTNGATLPSLAGSPSGAAVVGWVETGGTFREQAAIRAPDGTISDGTDLSGDQDIYSVLDGLGTGVDDQGNAVVGWVSHTGADSSVGYRVHIRGFDGSGPQLNALSIPATGTPATPLPFSVSPLDVWSGVAGTAWSFGDGATASGTSVTHAFAAGTHTVSVTATDTLGNASSAARSVSTPAPKDTTAPVLTHVKVKHRKLSFTLSEPAKVKVTIALKTKGVRKGKRCVKRRKHQRGRSCTRYVTKKTVTKTFTKAGAGSLTLPKLKHGTYRITVVATDAAGNKSKPVRVTLKVR